MTSGSSWGQHGAMTIKKLPPVKFNLRLPPAYLAKYQGQAEAMGLSLNAYTLAALDAFSAGRKLHGLIDRPAAPVKAPSASIEVKTWPKVGRNDPCPCGSGKKAKACHPAAC